MTRSRIAIISVATLIAAGAIWLGVLYQTRNPERKELTAAERRNVEGQFIRLRDGVTHYELLAPTTTLPSPRTAVLLHGFSVPYYIWDSTAVALSNAGYRVLRYDMYGRGWSDRPDARYSAVFHGNQLVELLDSLGIRERVDLMGLSMGGWVSASFVTRFPGRVRTLTLVDPVAGPRTVPEYARSPLFGNILWQTFAVPGMAAGQSSDFLKPALHPDWQSKYEPQMRYRGFGRALRSTAIEVAADNLDTLYASVAQYPVPVLLIWGREDRTVPFERSARVRAALPGAQFLAVDSAGHLPHIERASFVNQHLLEFLAANGDSVP